MKKAFLTFLTVTLIMVFGITNGVYASSSKIIFNEDPITDLNVLFELSKSNTSERRVLVNTSFLVKDKNNNLLTNKNINLETYEYTQKVKTILTSTGSEINTYCSTIFYDVYWYQESISNENLYEDKFIVTPKSVDPGGAGGGGGSFSYDESKTKVKWDGSYGVKAYSTVYWDVLEINGLPAIDIVNVSGGWIITDDTLDIDPIYVRMGQSDFLVSQSVQYNTVGTTFSYNAPSYWSPIYVNADHVFGVISYCKVYRGASYWYLQLNNNIDNFVVSP